MRAKYLKHVNQGSSVVVLQPEILKAFPTSEAVNKAFASMLAFAQQTQDLTNNARSRAVEIKTKAMGMNVNLTPQPEELLRPKVNSGMSKSASEVVREALRLMDEQDRQRSTGAVDQSQAPVIHPIDEWPSCDSLENINYCECSCKFNSTDCDLLCNQSEPRTNCIGFKFYIRCVGTLFQALNVP